MQTEPPRITDWHPAPSRVSQRHTIPRNVITPGEAFKRGFYGGLGLWCSFMALNIAAALLTAAVLMALGVIGAAAGSALH